MPRGLRIAFGPQVFDTFDVDASPLSGIWQARINLDLTDFNASGGKAIAAATGDDVFDDSAALLSGFGNNVDIVATVFKDAAINTGITHECELLLRATQSAHLSLEYECLFSFNGSIQCFRWEDVGGQDYHELSPSSGAITMGREFITGDRIRARISGSTITMSCIEANDAETVLGVFTDSTYTTGQPGIGGFTRPGGNTAHFCFQDVRVTQT